jgi:hypothetical protein
MNRELANIWFKSLREHQNPYSSAISFRIGKLLTKLDTIKEKKLYDEIYKRIAMALVHNNLNEGEKAFDVLGTAYGLITNYYAMRTPDTIITRLHMEGTVFAVVQDYKGMILDISIKADGIQQVQQR